MKVTGLFQQPFNNSDQITVGFALIGVESHVSMGQIALLVDDYDSRHGVQFERLVDSLVGVSQRRYLQIIFLCEGLQVGV